MAAKSNSFYDTIGRLISDVQEEIETIQWTVTNKVAYIERTTSSIQPDVAFKYDAMGNRIEKIVYPKSAPGVIETDGIKTTFYILDASGNLMATYEQLASSPSTTTLVDFDLYGASRLGVENVNTPLANAPNFNYCSVENLPSAIIQINGSEFITGESVVYKIGSLVLNAPVTWNGNVLNGVEKIISEVNKKTVTTDVSAELWWSNNTVNSYYIRFNYHQPGNWVNTQNVGTYINGTLATGPKYIPKRNLGLGECSGNDILGRKNYELSNHLGNVLAVITDRKMGVDDGVYNTSTGLRVDVFPDGVTDYYVATVVSYSDYYPYGMQLDNRHGEDLNADYRYGFQGQEKDDEVAGEGNSYTAQFWKYDPRLGRRWEADPVVRPFESIYATFGGNPVINIDPNGADWYKNDKYKKRKYKEEDESTHEYRWFEGDNKQEGYQHLGAYLLEKVNDELRITYQMESSRKHSLTKDDELTMLLQNSDWAISDDKDMYDNQKMQASENGILAMDANNLADLKGFVEELKRNEVRINNLFISDHHTLSDANLYFYVGGNMISNLEDMSFLNGAFSENGICVLYQCAVISNENQSHGKAMENLSRITGAKFLAPYGVLPSFYLFTSLNIKSDDEQAVKWFNHYGFKKEEYTPALDNNGKWILSDYKNSPKRNTVKNVKTTNGKITYDIIR